MDLSQRLARLGVSRVSVLIVEVPGWSVTRWAAEHDLRSRGWRTAMPPADADVLLTCGSPSPRLARAIDLTWEQLPGPRSRTAALNASEAGAALTRAADQLLDERWQRQEAADRPAGPAMGSLAEEPSSEDHDDGARTPDEDSAGGYTVSGHEGHDGMSHNGMGSGGEQGHGGMSHEGMGSGGHEGHGGMSHEGHGGDMDMSPGGIPLASGEDGDRDGLDLDVLHVPLGPVLPCWPAGLLLHCTLHGDVVADVRPEVLTGAPESTPESSFGTASDRLDRAAQLLTLAGWDDSAAAAARIRDDVVSAGDPASLVPSLDRLIRRVRRSRTLRWSLRGLGVIDAGFRRRHGLDGHVSGDVCERLIRFLTDARSALNGESAQRSPTPVALLPELVVGLELSALRLVVASVDLDPSHRPQVASA